jgi:sugar lactone lactonase YvrE
MDALDMGLMSFLAHPSLLACSLLLVACPDDGPSQDPATDTTDDPVSSTTAITGDSASGTTGSGTTAPTDESSGTTGEPCPAAPAGSDQPLLDLYDLEGDDLYPEGIAFDPQTRSFYVGSLEHGIVTRVDADGAQSLLAESPNAGWATVGMKVDPVARRLFACATAGELEGTDEVWIYDLDGCGLVEQVDLTQAAEGAHCNDLALAPDGAALVTDPGQGIVYRVVPGQAPAVWAQDPLLDPEGPLPFGLNGIAITPDEAFVVAVNLTAQRLVRIELTDPTSVVEVALTGDPLPQGGDGLLFGPDGVLYVMLDAEVLRVVLADGYGSGDVTTLTVPALPSGITTATLAEGEVYLTEGAAVARTFDQPPQLPFQLVRLPLR